MSTTLNLSLASSVNVAAGPQTLSPWRNPTQLEHPSFLLCFPFSYSTEVPNNPWMTVDDNRRQPNHKRAAIQFLELYRYLASEALVHILPTPREANLQDQLYTENLGIVLEHMEDKNTVVISNFTSDPRRGKRKLASSFSGRWATRYGFPQRSSKAKRNSSTFTKTSTPAVTVFALKKRPTSGWRRISIARRQASPD